MTRRSKYYGRIACDSVWVEVVAVDGRRKRIQGKVEQLAGQVLFLSTSQNIVPSTAVSVECDDVLFIGEVVASEKHTLEVAWRHRIHVEHALTSLESLKRLRVALLGELAASTLGLLQNALNP